MLLSRWQNGTSLIGFYRFRIVFEPRALLYHFQAGEGGNRLADQLRWHYWFFHNYTLLYLKNCPRKFLVFYLACRIGQIARRAVTRRNPALIAPSLRGLMEGLRDYRKR